MLLQLVVQAEGVDGDGVGGVLLADPGGGWVRRGPDVPDPRGKTVEASSCIPRPLYADSAAEYICSCQHHSDCVPFNAGCAVHHNSEGAVAVHHSVHPAAHWRNFAGAQISKRTHVPVPSESPEPTCSPEALGIHPGHGRPRRACPVRVRLHRNVLPVHRLLELQQDLLRVRVSPGCGGTAGGGDRMRLHRMRLRAAECGGLPLGVVFPGSVRFHGAVHAGL
mmetsp:Transcript_11667/g.26558  ORF Transcript_11667/g.26558 Transcript_11667/m.26558 type:complete len:222 (+) Transcript_11667:948-1613(+)